MATYLCFVAGRLDGVLTSLLVDDESGSVHLAGRTATGPRQADEQSRGVMP